MAARRGDASRRSYEDFDPSSEWIHEEGSSTFAIELPGFKKEQLKVQRDDARNLTITGERFIGDRKWSRFGKNIQVPAGYDINRLLANFENGVLKIIMPKINIIPTGTPPEMTPQKPPSQKSVTEPKFQPPPTPRQFTEPKLQPTRAPPEMTDPQKPPSQKPIGEPSFQLPPEQEEEQEEEREQFDGYGYGGPKKVTGEGNERYETAEECSDDDAARLMKNYTIRRWVAAGLEPKKLLVNVIVGILVALALLIYVKYTKGSSSGKATD